MKTMNQYLDRAMGELNVVNENYSDHNKQLVLREMGIWKGTMQFAAEQLAKGEYEIAMESLEQLKRIAGRLHTAVKNLKQDADKGVPAKKRSFRF